MCSEPLHRAGTCPECQGVVEVTVQERAPIRDLAVYTLLLLLVLCAAALAASSAGVSEDRISLTGVLVVPLSLVCLLAGFNWAGEEGFFCRTCGYSE